MEKEARFKSTLKKSTKDAVKADKDAAVNATKVILIYFLVILTEY